MRRVDDHFFTDLEKVLEDIHAVLGLAREEAVIRGRRDWRWAVVRTCLTAVAVTVIIWRTL